MTQPISAKRVAPILSFLAISLAATPARPITLTPGTLLGYDAGTDIISQYSTSGVLLDSLTVAAGSLSNVVGITTIGDRLFIADVLATVVEVDPLTGAIGTPFTVPNLNNIESLGRKGTNLITVGRDASRSLVEMTTSGTEIATTSIAAALAGETATGIDSDGSRVYMVTLAGSSGFGTLRVFDSVLAPVSTLGLTLRSLSGLAYDPSTGTFWMSDGFSSGGNTITQLALDGTVLTQFAAVGGTWTNAMTFVPESPVPEPGVLVLVTTGLAMIVVNRRRT